VLFQPLLTWWGIGYFGDQACMAKLATLSDSIYTYKYLTGKYPPNLKTLAQARLQVPTTCPVGGGDYYYLAPGTRAEIKKAATSSAPASSPTTTQAASALASAPALAAAEPMMATATATASTWGPTTKAATSSSAPATKPVDISGNPRGLMVAEVLDDHRGMHMCIMGDLSVKAFPQDEFMKLKEEPQNAEFAKGFHQVWTVATQPAPKEKKAASQPATASQSATSSSAPATAASQSATASRPATASQAATAAATTTIAP
jgi:hypothetical protein